MLSTFHFWYWFIILFAFFVAFKTYSSAEMVYSFFRAMLANDCRVLTFMNMVMVRKVCKQKIIDRIIELIPVYMVNKFLFRKFSVDMFFHNEAVFKLPFVRGKFNYPISTSVEAVNPSTSNREKALVFSRKFFASFLSPLCGIMRCSFWNTVFFSKITNSCTSKAKMFADTIVSFKSFLQFNDFFFCYHILNIHDANVFVNRKKLWQ